MIRRLIAALVAFVALPASAQVGGNLVAYPPVDVRVEITTDKDGAPVLSKSEFELITGEYYRIVIASDGKKDWRVELPDLLQNSHLRIVTINEVEVHLQGLIFRALEFDAKPNTASFTLTPVKPGDYQMYVGPNPLSLDRPVGESGVQPGAKSAFAKFHVR
jgi:hypothetical protein